MRRRLQLLALIGMAFFLLAASGAAAQRYGESRRSHSFGSFPAQGLHSPSNGNSNMQSYIKLKKKRQKEAAREKRVRDEALMLAPLAEDTGSSSNTPEKEQSPIVLATVDCYTPSSVLVRNLIFSIARFTTREHPVRFYILHSYDLSLLPRGPQSILCRGDDANTPDKVLGHRHRHLASNSRCQGLLRYLRQDRFIDVRFAPVANNSYVRVFRPCASSHLWFARSLPHEQKVVYLNRDMVVQQDLHALFSLFNIFPADTVLAAAFERNVHFPVRPRHVSAVRSGIKDRRGPYWVPPYGINAGMVLYDLQKMRSFQVVEDFEFIIGVNMSFPLGDQDVLNYYLSQQPSRFRAVSCLWNYRADPKRDADHCLDAGAGVGRGILHGSRKLYLEAAAHAKRDKDRGRPLIPPYYDGYVNATKELIVEFLHNNALMINDPHWPP